jgi:hypothetical protein
LNSNHVTMRMMEKTLMLMKEETDSANTRKWISILLKGDSILSKSSSIKPSNIKPLRMIQLNSLKWISSECLLLPTLKISLHTNSTLINH